MSAAAQTTYLARDLDEVPEVPAALRRLGLGRLRRGDLRAAVGRNDNWLGTTSTGQKVFIKRLHDGPGVDRARAQRLVRFEEIVAGRLPDLRTPACLGWDTDSGVFVYSWLQDAVPGSTLMVDERFTAAHAAEVAVALAALHSADISVDPGLDCHRSLMPQSSVLEGLPWPLFEQSSAAQLHAWALLQQDAQLRTAVAELERASADAPQAPTHCDLRVDQLLVTPEGVFLCDWEEFRVSDPARDTGSFVGEWLYRSVLDVPTLRGRADGDAPPDLDHQAAIERGVATLERLRPLISGFWATYTHGAALDADFAARTAAYAGWHLLDRLLAGGTNVARLQPIQRAAAGIGRRVLLDPGRSTTALGLISPDARARS